MRSPLMVWLCSAFSVRIKAAAALTVMDSLVEPTFRMTSTRIVIATCTRNPCWTDLLNPGADTITS